MKRIQKASELMWVLGVCFVALGVAICSKADLGVSMIAAPAFVVFEALAPLWGGFSVGMIEYAIQGVLLALLCLAVRRFNWRYLLAFAAAVLYGYALNLFLFVFRSVSFDGTAVRWMMMLVGDAITAFGVACFFRTYLPLQVYELFVAELSARFRLNINRTKWVFDISLLVVSVALAVTLFGDAGRFDWSAIGVTSFHSLGLGTLVTTLINSPLIALMGRLIDRLFVPSPCFPALEKVLKRS